MRAICATAQEDQKQHKKTKADLGAILKKARNVSAHTKSTRKDLERFTQLYESYQRTDTKNARSELERFAQLYESYLRTAQRKTAQEDLESDQKQHKKTKGTWVQSSRRLVMYLRTGTKNARSGFGKVHATL
jgi:multidrug resistance efflux pump